MRFAKVVPVLALLVGVLRVEPNADQHDEGEFEEAQLEGGHGELQGGEGEVSSSLGQERCGESQECQLGQEGDEGWVAGRGGGIVGGFGLAPVRDGGGGLDIRFSVLFSSRCLAAGHLDGGGEPKEGRIGEF